MADRIEELFLKEFTSAELIAGTRHDFTTDSSTAYAVKDVEFTQGSDDDAVSGSVTASKTTDFSAGKFSTLGTFGSRVDSLSGSAVLDVSSTLSIRPDAKAISYKDVKLQLDNSNNANQVGPIVEYLKPTVNGNAESVTTTAQVATGAGSSPGNFTSGMVKEYSIVHTNANGIKLYIRFAKGQYNTSGVYIVGMDNSTNYASFTSTYTEHLWDGERYIYWADNDYIYFFDTDDANITNPSNHSTTCHGRMTVTGIPTLSPQSYDHRRGSITTSAHDGKTYVYQWYNSQQYGIVVELPSTISDGGTCPKFWKTGSGSYGASGTDPFGNNSGSAWNMYAYNNNVSEGQYTIHQITTFTDLKSVKRWAIMMRNTSDEAVWLMWKDADMQALASGDILGSNDSNINSTDGITCISTASLSDDALLWNTVYFSASSQNAFMHSGGSYLGTGNSDWQSGSYNVIWLDGITVYQGNTSSNYNVFEIDLTQTSFPALFTTNEYTPYQNNFWMMGVTPSQATIDARTYTKAPSLTVRCTGVKEDRS